MARGDRYLQCLYVREGIAPSKFCEGQQYYVVSMDYGPRLAQATIRDGWGNHAYLNEVAANVFRVGILGRAEATFKLVEG